MELPKKPFLIPIDESKIIKKENQKFVDGSTYTGHMIAVTEETGEEALIKHGFGTKTWPDGASYVGDWRDGFAHGKGIFYHANGDYYEGEFI